MPINYDNLELIRSGSVKDIYRWTRMADDPPDLLLFHFTDHTSVKDYGRLPFTIPDKGKALCEMAATNFVALEKAGIPTCFMEQVADDAIIVKSVSIVDPDKEDLSRYHSNVLIPLEIICRNVVTETSSAQRRLEKGGGLHPWQLGLPVWPNAYPVVLPLPFVEGSTKLRQSDEYLPWKMLVDLCKVPFRRMSELDLLTRKINQYALQRGSQSGLVVFDFKVEYGLDEHGDVFLIDVPLAVDEITCAYTGPFADLRDFSGKLKVFVPGKNHSLDAAVNTSKQIIRDHYDAAEPEWVAALEQAKREKKSKAEYPKPNPIPDELIDLASEMFKGLANAWGGAQHFSVKSLDETAREYKEWARKFYEIDE